MTTGYLSQTIQNIIVSKNYLIDMIGLPNKASKIRNQAVELIKKNSVLIGEVQSDLLKDSAKILKELQNASILIKEQGAEASALINSAHNVAVLSKTKLESALEYNLVVKTSLLKFSQELQNVRRELQNHNAQLIVDEQKAKNKASKFKKERFYFLALGPFGLSGLATATALFVKWNAKATNAKKKIMEIRNQMNSLKQFQESINALQENFSLGIEALSNVKNALEFLSGDIKNIINNSNTTDKEPIVIQLYLNAAIKEATILLIDAS